MNWPNKITLVRVFLIPVNVIFLINRQYFWFIVSLTFSFLTDALDGFLARVLKQRTEIGTFLDPLADKLLINTIYITFSVQRIVPWWISILVISRDLIIVGGWTLEYILADVSVIRPSMLGKLTTFAQMSFLLTAFLGHEGVILPPVFNAFTAVTVALTIASGLHYVQAGMKRMN